MNDRKKYARMKFIKIIFIVSIHVFSRLVGRPESLSFARDSVRSEVDAGSLNEGLREGARSEMRTCLRV